ncbi:MAG: hypothetical protein ACRCTD_07840 [Beijerinckiaceae bacterium]
MTAYHGFTDGTQFMVNNWLIYPLKKRWIISEQQKNAARNCSLTIHPAKIAGVPETRP